MAQSALMSRWMASVPTRPSFDEGYVTVSRGVRKEFSIYYRMYNKNESIIPLLVVHGGPYVSCCFDCELSPSRSHSSFLLSRQIAPIAISLPHCRQCA